MSEGERRALGALVDSLALLQAAVTAQDGGAEWRCTRDVLEWLHVLDDAATTRLGRENYRSRRAATEDGRTQAALTLVRGIAHHHLAEVQASMLRRSTMFSVDADGALVPVQVYAVQASGLVPVTTHSVITGWPPLSDMPASAQPLHGRDRYYADHVEGRELLPTLLAAQRFLTDVQNVRSS